MPIVRDASLMTRRMEIIGSSTGPSLLESGPGFAWREDFRCCSATADEFAAICFVGRFVANGSVREHANERKMAGCPFANGADVCKVWRRVGEGFSFDKQVAERRVRRSALLRREHDFSVGREFDRLSFRRSDWSA